MNPNILLLVAIILVVIVVVAWLGNRNKVDVEWKSSAKSKAAGLRKQIENADTDELKHVLIKADSLLDYCLQNYHLRGKTMGERLKSANRLFTHAQYDQVWQAHKMRNSVVHDIDTSFSSTQVKAKLETLLQAVSQLSK